MRHWSISAAASRSTFPPISCCTSASRRIRGTRTRSRKQRALDRFAARRIARIMLMEITRVANERCVPMLEYHAAYYSIDDGWFMVRVLDFPGVISQGKSIEHARKMIKDAL